MRSCSSRYNSLRLSDGSLSQSASSALLGRILYLQQFCAGRPSFCLILQSALTRDSLGGFAMISHAREKRHKKDCLSCDASEPYTTRARLPRVNAGVTAEHHPLTDKLNTGHRSW